ncbi:hypothetical protein PC116_g7029 [Phytophthora cactorum]|uniref:Uncharacterized protein n=1 Tax=Phytophthora cactorum TaxID=29920 RepID=A0A8T1B2M4_9STRA|nr:hypothetical protein PC114_g23999 [Phytophthora cactorum]KAG2893742.1 hypothetical protein PC117_g23696 [Phytophthora cactorum]KAG2965146.1 hypothetical protein PC119_g25062 [Phytophthora cactorum]KAG2980772.1 hypothetical protein PC120_g24904 [Phytophthora cactorum]KAG3129051.1 hypothetical protein C6341_g24298 [Phytophthora cactorum]
MGALFQKVITSIQETGRQCSEWLPYSPVAGLRPYKGTGELCNMT